MRTEDPSGKEYQDLTVVALALLCIYILFLLTVLL